MYPKISPDELIAKSVYPALRAMIAVQLVKKYSFKQQDAAKKLGVTQAAISYYLTNKRGISKTFLKSEFIMESIDKFAEGIAKNKISDFELIMGLAKLVDYILENRELCELHKEFEHGLNIEECHICDDRFKISSKDYLNNLLKKINKV